MVAGLALLSQDLNEEYVDGASSLTLMHDHQYDPLVSDRNHVICSQPMTPE